MQRTPRNAYNFREALRLMRRAAEEENVSFENHGWVFHSEPLPELRLSASALLLAGDGLRFFGSLNEYRHQRLRRKRRQLLPKLGDVVGQLIGSALNCGRLGEDKRPKLARLDAVGRQVQP